MFELETPTDSLTLPSGIQATVRAMLGADENILFDRRILKEGKQTSRFLANVVTELNGSKPTEKDIRELYMADRRALLLAVRILTFGPELSSTQVCPNCEVSNDISLDLEEDIEFTPASENLESQVVLPLSKYVVTVAPIKGVHEERLFKMADSDEKITDVMIMYLKKVVSPSGEEVSNAKYREFLKAVSVRDLGAIRKTMENTEFGPETQIEYTCPNCGNKQRHDITQFGEFYLPPN